MSTTITNPQKSAGEQITDHFEELLNEYYLDEIATLAQKYPKEKTSLFIEARDLAIYSETKDCNLREDWINNPNQMQGYAEEALTRVDLPAPVDLSGATIRLTDSNGYLPTKSVSEIDSKDIGTYMGVRGILERVSEVKHKLREAVFECHMCTIRTTIVQSGDDLQEPHQCSGCERKGPFNIVEDESTWANQRKLKVKGLPGEGADNGTQRGGEKIGKVYNDLCDVGGKNGLPDRTGSEVIVFGEISLKPAHGKQDSTEFDSWVDVKAIHFESDDIEDLDIEEHKETFMELADRDDAIQLCADSLAPRLYREPGDDLYDVTKAAIAYAFNGYRIDTEDRGSMRGDIHFGVFGDPGVGKSTVLSDLADILPKCIKRSTAAMTGAGLTATAVQEEFDGRTQWALEPGVLPRGNGGHTIIDEIDDLEPEKANKMHDALEGDQVLSVDKADISAELPTRTALLISGNPKKGRFDQYEPFSEQLELDPALLDRMDLLFAMQDQVDEEKDTKKSDHVLETTDAMMDEFHDDLDEDEEDEDARPVPKDVLTAWIAYAQREVFPRLTPESKEVLQDFYIEVRNANDGHDNKEGEEPIPATMRSLEAGIRLSMAFARVNLSETIDAKHAETAVELSKQVIGLNFDPDSGYLDASKMDAGTTQSREERHDAIISTLNEMCRDDEYKDEKGVPREDLKEALEAERVSTDKFERDIERLSNQRRVYSPDGKSLRAIE